DFEGITISDFARSAILEKISAGATKSTGAERKAAKAHFEALCSKGTMTALTTERLILRPPRDGDEDAVFTIHSD
ncbi:hypothetical protein CJ199_13155, partial [Brevibacterium paucivorans]